jgi:hypothetical protein
MSIYEIKEKLEDYYSVAEIIELLSNIDKEEIEEYAKEHFICPKCFGDLKLITYYESRGEHFGFPATEEMSKLVCENECGWVDNE